MRRRVSLTPITARSPYPMSSANRITTLGFSIFDRLFSAMASPHKRTDPKPKERTLSLITEWNYAGRKISVKMESHDQLPLTFPAKITPPPRITHITPETSTFNRRSFLRGTGLTLALPLMESLLPASAQEIEKASRSQRMATISVPFGMVVDQFHPASYGPGYQLSPTLHPLAKHKSDFTVFFTLASTCSSGSVPYIADERT